MPKRPPLKPKKPKVPGKPVPGDPAYRRPKSKKK